MCYSLRAALEELFLRFFFIRHSRREKQENDTHIGLDGGVKINDFYSNIT